VTQSSGVFVGPSYAVRSDDGTWYELGMQEKRPSQTAAMVAALRALADEGFTNVRGFRDPYVRELLSPAWSLFLRAARRLGPSFERFPSLYEGRDYMPLRVRAIDDELGRAIEAGARQLVILGAGLDTRAHRLEQLRDVAVFEVDHPASQAYKTRRAASLPRAARSIAYVAVDFEREPIGPRLAAAGHDPNTRTVWIWEGVVMYLSDAGFRSTLRSIVAVSGRSSSLLIHYHEPDASTGRHAINALLAIWREPQVGLRTRASMARELSSAGLLVEGDSGAAEWAAQFGAPAPTSVRGLVMRLVVATKR
jgi:methyltransferase (TIGR00027 family)